MVKVFLTGATGFVGSHILDALRQARIPTAILLRKESDTNFIREHLSAVELHYGSISDSEELTAAMRGATHVIHCAGCTKANKTSEYFRVNSTGAQVVVDAAVKRGVQRFIHISSLAASHPATASSPAREDELSQPVTPYGRSKLDGEQHVLALGEMQFVILRPAAVYGPRDRDFFVMFKTLKRRLNPLYASGRQQLSLAYVKDVAAAALACLERGEVNRQICNVASPEVVTAKQIAEMIAQKLGVNPIQLPVPKLALWLGCAAQNFISKLSGSPNIVSLEKFPELNAPGWVCSTEKLSKLIGFTCPTSLEAGIGDTLKWYRENGWLT